MEKKQTKKIGKSLARSLWSILTVMLITFLILLAGSWDVLPAQEVFTADDVMKLKTCSAAV